MITDIPYISPLTTEDSVLYTDPLPVAMLDEPIRFAISSEICTEECIPHLISCIINFRELSLAEFHLRTQEAVFACYQETYNAILAENPDYARENLPVVDKPENIWSHVTFGEDLVLQRRHSDDEWEVALKCECAWEQSHGLAIGLIDGNRRPIAAICDDVI